MHETAQIHLKDAASRIAFEAACAALPGHLAAKPPGCWGAGHYTWDSDAPNATTLDALSKLPGVERVDTAHYTIIGSGTRALSLRQGIKRTLLLRVRPDADHAKVEQFERELLQMPHYMPGILNWSLGRTQAGSHWSHVWQQEFQETADLQGEYMLHPYHWAWVDRWFDPEHPACMVDGMLCHAFCPISASILAQPLRRAA